MSFTRLEDFIFEQIAETKLASVAAAIVKNGEVVWSRAFGFRDAENGLPATPHTLYGIGSVTKSFTAIALLQLAEQGKLSLDDPVQQHIPAFTLKPFGEPVRLWHFLSHSSGIPALAYAEAVIDSVTGARENWLPVASYEDLLAFLHGAEDWVRAMPGERWFYFNEGYALLGHIVEVCSGQPYPDYVRDHILTPLGMTRSFFARADVDGDPDAAVPYLLTDEGQRIRSTYAYGTITADGGLISSVLDMAQYVAMFLRGGESADGTPILAPESLASMQTPRVPLPVQDFPYGEGGYALGLQIASDFLGQRMVGHGGSVGTATAYLGFIPGKNVGVVLLANGSGYAMSQFGQVALALLLDQDPADLPFLRRETLLKALEGSYETFKGTTQWQIRRAGDFLFMEEANKYGQIVVPLVPDKLGDEVRTFYTLNAGVKVPVEFRVQGDQVECIYERYLLRRTGKLT